MASALQRLLDLRDRAGVYLDFDGTLADIAPTPADVSPAPGVVDVLERLVVRFARVAVVTGRPSAEVRGFLPVPGLVVFGVYGLEGEAASLRGYRDALNGVAASVPGAWVEDKDVSLTVHFRQASDPDDAEVTLRRLVGRFAEERGLRMLEGKRALEVTASLAGGKGEVVRQDVRARGLDGCLYAGDDVADLEAFEALGRLGAHGIETLAVGVRSPETPPDVVARADVVVEGPAGLVLLLDGLAG